MQEPFLIHIYLSLMCLKQIIHLHDDVDAKETFNYVLQKNINNSTTYAQELKDFIESQRSFFDTPQVDGLKLFPYEWWDLIGIGGCTLTPIV
jgi:hypothetical protein